MKRIFYKILHIIFGHKYSIIKPTKLPEPLKLPDDWKSIGPFFFGYSASIYNKNKNNRLKYCKLCGKYEIYKDK